MKMNAKLKYLPIAAVAAVALSLAGCGGGGDDGPVATTMPEAPAVVDPDAPAVVDPDAPAVVDPALTTEEALTAAEVALAEAMAALVALEAKTDPAAGLVELAEAQVAVNAAQTAFDAAKTANDAFVSALPENVAARMAAEEAAAAAAVVAATKAAGTKVTAIAAEAMQSETDGVDADIGGSLPTDQDASTYLMTIARDRDGTKVTIADTALPGDDDPKFLQAMDFGGGRTMHVRTMEANDDGEVVEEVVVVRTDIDAPKATPFAMVAEQTLDVSTNTDNDVQGETATFEALTVDGDSADVRALVMSGAFVPGAGSETVLMFADDDTTTNDMDEAFETAGTYNGADGTYRCNGEADCTVTLDADGDITAISVGWIFTPDPGATSDVADADYQNYGFWLKRTTDEDGVLTYDEVETFAGSSVPVSGSVASVTGNASYKGGATGVYVKNVYDTLGDIESATSGHFTADAILKAYFGGTSVAGDLQNTVTGTIDNFALSGDEANAWAVNLEGDITEADGIASGAATGGGTPGTFSATFHGSVEAVEEVVPQPSSVVGEFDANFSNGTVAGGFGARKQ